MVSTCNSELPTINGMGFYQPVFGSDGTTFPDLGLKKTFQWFFDIPNLTSGMTGLPCIKSSRPKINFREMQAEHLNETIYYPSKPEWQNIQLELYDRNIGGFENPIFSWIKMQYDPTPAGCSSWFPCIDPLSFKPCATLTLLDGCGNISEQWIFEHVYPVNIDWDDLNMGESSVVIVKFTLRYDRAWQSRACNSLAATHALYQDQADTVCNDCPPATCGTGEGLGGSSSSSSDSGNSGGGANDAFAPPVREPDFVMF